MRISKNSSDEIPHDSEFGICISLFMGFLHRHKSRTGKFYGLVRRIVICETVTVHKVQIDKSFEFVQLSEKIEGAGLGVIFYREM